MTATPNAFSVDDDPELVQRLGRAHLDVLIFSGQCSSREDLEKAVQRYERAAAHLRPTPDNVLPIAGGFTHIGDATQRVLDEIAVKRAIRQPETEGN